MSGSSSNTTPIRLADPFKVVTLKLDAQQTPVSAVTTTNSLNNSLNIITKKPATSVLNSNNSIFIVPSAHQQQQKVTLMSMSENTKMPLNSLTATSASYIVSPISKKIIFNASSSNTNHPINTKLFNTANVSSLNNSNKIQFVKIVNPSGNSNVIVNQIQHGITTNKPIKITTISANTNTNAIITTSTTNSENMQVG